MAAKITGPAPFTQPQIALLSFSNRFSVFFFIVVHTYTKISVFCDVCRFTCHVKWFHWRMLGERCDPGWCCCKDIRRAIARGFLLSKEREGDTFSGQCGVLPATPPKVCCPLCSLWGLSGRWTPAWVEQNSSSSHQVVVWIVVFFLSFSSQKASSRCGLLVNSWSQVVMGELFLSVYTTQCKKLWFWNTLCKDCKKKCPHLSHTKALLEKPFAMCRAERN